MNKDDMLNGVLVEKITFIELCNKHHLPRELIIEMIEEGLLPLQVPPPEQTTLDQKIVHRIETALRLHHDLRINLPGVILAVELLDEMEALRKELDILRKHF